MASKNVLQQLRNILNGSFSSAEREEKLSLLGDECARIVDMERKKAVDGRVRSLSVCQFARSQFPNSEESRCFNYYPVR